MKGKLIFLLIMILSFAFISFSKESTSANSEINSLNIKTSELENVVGELESIIKVYEIQQRDFAFASNSALQFVRAMTTGNREALDEMLSNEFELVNKNKDLYVTVAYDDNEVEWKLFSPTDHYKDMVVQGYTYDEEKNTYVIHTRLFYLDSDGNDISPPVFLTLFFQPHSWKIIDLYFDV